MLEFKPWPKIPRWKRDIIITEKIDGTCSSVFIDRFTRQQLEDIDSRAINEQQHLSDLAQLGQAVELEMPDQGALTYVRAGSRTTFIYPGKDNFGFAAWVWDHAADLTRLGPGAHYGEWYGSKIQRGYGMTERRFALFNVGRWSGVLGDQEPPNCCDVVPVLYRGPMTLGHGEDAVDFWMRKLGFAGSEAEGAHGFKPPEGIVIYHVASRNTYKYTFEGDDHKGNEAS